jgi:WD40 repeat protein
LLRCIGQGSYGQVWLARGITGAYRAVKVIYRAHFEQDGPFEREFVGIQRFEPISRMHESQMHILHVGRNEQEDYFYYVMELADDANEECGGQIADSIQGGGDANPQSALRNPQSYAPKTLKHELKRCGALPFDHCLRLGLSLTTALEHLHRHGLIHRDVKPSNIIFVRGVPKLADIGLVTSYDATLSFVGTAGYMPPEGPGTPQADLYSLGKVLYETSTGLDRSEFPTMPPDLQARRDHEDLLEFAAVVLKACAPDPHDRYQSAREMHADLALLQSGRSVKRHHRMERRLALMTRAGIALTALLAVAVGAWVFQRGRTLEAQQAQRRIEHAQQGLQRAHAELSVTLSRSYTEKAEANFAADHSGTALMYLARALRQDPSSRVAAARLLAALTQRNFPLPICPPLVHTSLVCTVEFSPDGQRVLTASADGTARVWDARTGHPLTPPMSHRAEVRRAHFSPDGRRVLTASWDHSAALWDSETGRRLCGPLQHAGKVRSAQFSHDGQKVLTASSDRTARVWDARTGHPLTEPLPHQGRVLSAQFSPDAGRVATACQDGTARIWDATTGQPLTSPLRHDGQVQLCQFSPDGRRLVTASNDKTACAWDAETGQRLFTALGHEDHVYFVRFSPDGHSLVTGSTDNTARLWDAASGQPRGSPMRHDGDLADVWFSPDGSLVLTVALDRTARLWDARTGAPVSEPIRHAEPLRDGRFSPNGQQVVTASHDGTARIWDVRPGQALPEPVAAEQPLKFGQFSPNGRQLLLGMNGSLWIRDWPSGRNQVGPLTAPGGLRLAQYGDDGRWVLAATANTVFLWDAATGERLPNSITYRTNILSARLSRDGRRLAIVAGDGTARVWDPATGQPLTPPLTRRGDIGSVEFSPDGERIVTASLDNAAWIWWAQSGQVAAGPLRHAKPIYNPVFSPDGKLVVTASGDGTACLWEARTGRLLTPPLRHNAEVLCARFSTDGLHVVTGSEDRTARLWEVPSVHSAAPEWLPRLAETVAGQRFNARGTVEPVAVTDFLQLRTELLQGRAGEPCVSWAQWFFADRGNRLISPHATLTVPAYVQGMLQADRPSAFRTP